MPKTGKSHRKMTGSKSRRRSGKSRSHAGHKMIASSCQDSKPECGRYAGQRHTHYICETCRGATWAWHPRGPRRDRPPLRAQQPRPAPTLVLPAEVIHSCGTPALTMEAGNPLIPLAFCQKCNFGWRLPEVGGYSGAERVPSPEVLRQIPASKRRAFTH